MSCVTRALRLHHAGWNARPHRGPIPLLRMLALASQGDADLPGHADSLEKLFFLELARVYLFKNYST